MFLKKHVVKLLDFLRILEGDDRIGKTVYRNLLRILVRRLRKREKEYDFILVSG